jgi:EAL domain-containing protein (putative c-di-GMP-specific phosphodiesterase class I)
MANADASTATLLKLKDRGIQIRLDDFGTGYSSLSYLQRLPVDTLKIDRSFVGRMGAAGEKAEIIHSIVTLARSLGMEVMAEGVETAYQLARLRELTCDSAQGWFFSKPRPAQEIRRLIASRPRW